MRTHDGRLALIQIARGVAALLVVMAHANLMVVSYFLNGLLTVGSCGIHFFFVLSGFIIFYSHVAHLGNPQQLWPYIVKRLKRVYPIYWIYTFSAFAIDLGINFATGKHFITWLGQEPGRFIYSLTLWPTNVAANEMPILPVAWTLTYEVLFYSFFCIFLLFRWVLGFVLAIAWTASIVAAHCGYISPENKLLEILLSPLNLEFFLGCIAGYITTGIRWRPSPLLTYGVLLLGLSMLSVSWYNAFFQYNLFAKNDVLQFGVPFFIIILSIAFLDMFYLKNRDSPFLKIGVYFGEASYSIYLIHFIILALLAVALKKIGVSSHALSFILVVSVAVLIACLCYNFIERPLLYYLGRR